MLRVKLESHCSTDCIVLVLGTASCDQHMAVTKCVPHADSLPSPQIQMASSSGCVGLRHAWSYMLKVSVFLSIVHHNILNSEILVI